jgi:hypothetical protein
VGLGAWLADFLSARIGVDVCGCGCGGAAVLVCFLVEVALLAFVVGVDGRYFFFFML